jgi:hypothetical protein
MLTGGPCVKEELVNGVQVKVKLQTFGWENIERIRSLNVSKIERISFYLKDSIVDHNAPLVNTSLTAFSELGS